VRQAEVAQLAPVVRGEQDVLELEVAVRHALAVQELDAAHDLDQVAPRVALLELAAPDDALEELTGSELHEDVDLAALELLGAQNGDEARVPGDQLHDLHLEQDLVPRHFARILLLHGENRSGRSVPPPEHPPEATMTEQVARVHLELTHS